MVSDSELCELAARVGQKLRAAERRLVTAESCTGGWVAKVLTDVPGSSQWFECGYVTYSNAAKMRDLQQAAEGAERALWAKLHYRQDDVVAAAKPLAELAQQNMQLWAKMQASLFEALTPSRAQSPGKPGPKLDSGPDSTPGSGRRGK